MATTSTDEWAGKGEKALGTTLRIVSANLLNGAADPEAFARLVSRLSPDAVAVQELGPDQAEALATVLPHGLLMPRTDYDGGGIALAQPGEVSRLPLGGRPGFQVRLGRAGWSTPLEVFNVHVYAPHAHGGLGLWKRRPQLRDLLRHVDRPASGGRVVIGDFNATPLWPVYRRMAARMEDAASRLAEREEQRAQRTWSPRPGATPLLRIDHAFVEGVTPEAFEVLPIEGSDHHAIVLDIAGDVALAQDRFR